MKKAKFIHILIMCGILFWATENSDLIIQFFSQAEDQIAKFSEDYSNGLLVDRNELEGLEDSGITGQEYTFDTKFYPYYDMLSMEGQILYKQVYANMKERKTTFVPTLNITTSEVQQVMEAVFNDHPEFFWINTIYTYKYVENNVVVQITLDFNETINSFESSKKAFDKVANRIIEGAKKLNSNYEKELYVHDEILKIASYKLDVPMNQSAYSALVNGNTVCAGYARAFQYIMIKLGIPTYYVSGYSMQDHAWNIVLLGDGYYNVDLTWDNSTNSHQYFNLTELDISKTHKRKGLSTKLPFCQSTKYKFIEPSNNQIPNQNNNTIIEDNPIIEDNIIIDTEDIPNNHHHNLNHGHQEDEHDSHENMEIIY